MFYIRTQYLDEMVGRSRLAPELFATRAEARRRADELADATPSKYGRLIVSEWHSTPTDRGLDRLAFTIGGLS